ncbi:MAG: hypothetical protein ABGX12_04560 [Desulfurobacteriaceae bacterium]
MLLFLFAFSFLAGLVSGPIFALAFLGRYNDGDISFKEALTYIPRKLWRDSVRSHGGVTLFEIFFTLPIVIFLIPMQIGIDLWFMAWMVIFGFFKFLTSVKIASK